MDIYAVAFFGHRQVYEHGRILQQLEAIIMELLQKKEYVEFLVGRNGDFDQLVSSAVRHMKRTYRNDNSSLVLALPYLTAEYANNQKSYETYYDQIEVSHKAAQIHPKAAIQFRNREMVDRADLVICYLEHNNGGAYQTVQYAKRKGKTVINLADAQTRQFS